MTATLPRSKVRVERLYLTLHVCFPAIRKRIRTRCGLPEIHRKRTPLRARIPC